MTEPIALWTTPAAAPVHDPSLRARRFEYSSRGDRVPGLLLLPAEGHGPFPLVLLQHGAGGSKHSDYLDAARLPWVRRGIAVASIDFPLHGERSSAKLSEQLLGVTANSVRTAHADTIALWSEFSRQSVVDLGRAFDALAEFPELDAQRVAYAGFSLGAILGALFCPTDSRPRAAALALGGAGIGPPDFDPAAQIGAFAPRPLLFVNATRDERIPRAAAEALHAAAGDPKQIAWFECGHNDLPGAGLKTMWSFLAKHLNVA
jgi:dienelactone hydrolase